jgi:hypothetical protein
MSCGLLAAMSSSGALLAQPDAAAKTIHAELKGQIDSKHARAGDRVVLCTTDSWKSSGNADVPVGARLIGQVTQGKAHDGNHPDGMVVLVLERAEWKNEKGILLRIPIHAELEAIEPPPERPSEYALYAPMVGGWGKTDSVRDSGAGSGAASTIRSSTPGLGSTQDGAQPVGKQPASASAAAGMNDGTGVPLELSDSETIIGKTTGFKGIFLACDAPEVSSGTIFAKGKNLHLDGGTVFTLAVKAQIFK